MIYLDNAATTFPKPETVYQTMDYVNRNLAVNAGRGSYKIAQNAVGIIEKTREQIKNLFDCNGVSEVVLTPSITHALNQVVRGLEINSTSIIYTSPYEHNAVIRSLAHISNETGCKVVKMPVTASLEIDIAKLEYLFISDKPSVVILNAMSNVTGYILPFREIFTTAKKYNAVTILDTAQAAGIVPISAKTDNADIICFAGHKSLYGPFGVGGFAIKNGVALNVVLTGGTGSNSLNNDMPQLSPAKYEASSFNIVAISGLSAALETLEIDKHSKYISELTDYLYTKLQELSKINVVGYIPGKCMGIVSFVVEGYSSDDVGKILDEEFDIAVRTGYHCAPDIHDLLSDKEYNGTVRVGIGQYTTKEEIDSLINALETL